MVRFCGEDVKACFLLQTIIDWAGSAKIYVEEVVPTFKIFPVC